MEFSHMEECIFQNLAQASKPDLHYRPRSRTFQSIDAIHVGQGTFNAVFQMTVAKTYGIKVKGLQDILSTYEGKKVQFYFVVPEDIFPEFKSPQNYIISGGTKCASVPPEIVDGVEQWVLKLKYFP